MSVWFMFLNIVLVNSFENCVISTYSLLSKLLYVFFLFFVFFTEEKKNGNKTCSPCFFCLSE